MHIDTYILIWFFEKGFLCIFGACLELAFVDQTGLKLIKICVTLPPEWWD